MLFLTNKGNKFRPPPKKKGPAYKKLMPGKALSTASIGNGT